MPAIIEEGEEGEGEANKGWAPPVKNVERREEKNEMREKTEAERGKEKVQ